MTTQDKNFYITTPIYYGNGVPHVGHFYSSMIADTIARYHKISGYNTRFTTGIDENSQKSVMKAEEEGLKIQEYLDTMAKTHKDTWDHFAFDYTDFIRTTEPRHHSLVQKVLQKCFDAGDIYEGEYEGMYCVGCEAFKKDDDLIEQDGKKVCPDHLKVPDSIKEKNYFFKLSKYQTWIEEFYEANPTFVNPDLRFNEVRAFVGRGLEDFSISRETITFGIPLPFDNSQVTYVWFDALFNYYTSLVSSPFRKGDGGRLSGAEKSDGEGFIDESEFWIRDDYENNKILHIIGKDILRFHAIFWPAMLASYFTLGKKDADGVIHFDASKDFKYLPNQLLSGGYFTVDGQKMSKSLGNVIDPISYSDQYSKDLLALYMLSAFPIGNDGDYDRGEAIKLYNAKLANNFGNLVNRVVVLSLKLENQLGEGISDFKDLNWQDYNKYMVGNFGEAGENITESYVLLDDVQSALDSYNLKKALDTIFVLLDGLNKFVDATEPWGLIKTDTQKAEIVLFIIARRILMISYFLYAFFPEKIGELYEKFGLVGYTELLEAGKLDELRAQPEKFNITEKGSPLFERFEV